LVAGLRRLHRLRRVSEALAAVHGRPHELLREGRERRHHALCEYRPRRALAERRDRPRRADPGRIGRRRRPRARCEAIPRHRTGHLPHNPADGRRAEFMTPVRVLSVASEVYPLVKTGGLADVAGALPIALKAAGIDVRTLVPGYPGVMKALERA